MTANLNKILEEYWGFRSFRPLQEQVINAVMAKKDVLVLMPTGGGKSLCFQVPSLAQPGLCIVVSPLIGLMKDQVQGIKQKGIYAAAVYSGMSNREIDIALDNCINGPYKFLYVSPERLLNELFLTRLQSMPVNLIAVDEAHCISQWGYDFRPPYLQIAELKEHLPGVPLIALTATATPRVKKDIIEKLNMGGAVVYESSYKRENLSYCALFEEDKNKRMVQLLNAIPGSGLIYVNRRRRAEEIFRHLDAQCMSVSYYHAGLTAVRREEAQQAWMENRTQIMVCTNAFGMGIDKPDVRLVIHADMPANPESYFQEAGRVGRDGLRAYAVLLYNDHDILKLNESLINKFPTLDKIRGLYSALCKYFNIAFGEGESQTFDFLIDDFIKKHPYTLAETTASLHWLEHAGYITPTESAYRPSMIKILFNNQQLQKFESEFVEEAVILKTLLRSAPGIMDNYISINEYALAKPLRTGKGFIQNKLRFMHQKGLLDYVESKSLPQIVFNFPRPKDDAIYVDKIAYNKQYELARERIHWITTYAGNTTACRQLALRRYFGETAKDVCGICDVCKGRYNGDISKDDFKTIHDTLNKLLSTRTDIKIEMLENYLTGISKAKWHPVLKQMLDDRIVIIKPDFTLQRVKA